MVRRLVEQQHVEIAEQHFRHRHAHLPTARERADVAVDLIVGEAEAVQHLASARFELVPAVVLILLLHFPVASERLFIVKVLLQLDQLVMQIAETSAPRDRLIEHRPPAHLVHLLPEVPDRELLRNTDRAVVRRFLAADHPKQRRLPRAVRPHEPGLFAGIELKRRLDEEDLLAVLLADVGEGDHAGRGNSRGRECLPARAPHPAFGHPLPA